LDTIDKFCPACKRKNDGEATVCAYCGASLESEKVDQTTERMKKVTLLLPDIQESIESARPISPIPPGAIAIYVLGETKPIAISEEEEFILGRHVIEGSDNIIDLTPYGGLEKGVSRKHAIIRKAKIAFEIVDLYSTNGTWINEKRLMPNKAYPLDSGIQIRLGQMLLFTLFGQTNGS